MGWIYIVAHGIKELDNRFFSSNQRIEEVRAWIHVTALSRVFCHEYDLTYENFSLGTYFLTKGVNLELPHPYSSIAF